MRCLTVFALFGLVLTLGSGAPAQSLRENLVGGWTFDQIVGDTVEDISPHGNNGTVVGGVQRADGQHGKALQFDGSSVYVEIPFSESLRVLNEGDFTLVAWFWALALPGENREVFQQMDRNGTGRTWLFVHGDTNEIRSYLGGATTSSGVLLEPGVWYHAAVVVTEGGGSDTVQLYVNGEPAGAPTPQAMESSEGNYLIGCHKNFTNFWNGLIDEVALFNRALSPEEIQALMNEGLEGALSVDPAGKLSLFWGGLKRSAW